VGVGCATLAVSFKWEALLENYNERGGQGIPDAESVHGGGAAGLMLLQAAMEDENLPKLCWNKQADKAIWEAQVGPICGQLLDGMLMHHGAFPGIDHDLQQGASQFLCIPPWKVDHQRVVAEHKVEERQQAKNAKEAERERKKAERVAAHEERNRKLHEDKLARKAAKAAAKAAKSGLPAPDPKQLVLGGVE